MKILVTGSDGYLGNVLVPMLISLGHEVIGIDLGIFNHGQFLKFDLSEDNLDSIDSKGIDAIVHLAGISNDPSCELHPDLTTKMNVIASNNLIAWACKNKIRKFIFASSASVYGIGNIPSAENSILRPQSDYATSKIDVENFLSFRRLHGELDPVILRFGTLFGYSPKMRFDLAINLMTKSAYTEGAIKVFGSGDQFRPFLHVSDAARAIIHGLNYNGFITTNIVKKNIKVIELARHLEDLFRVSVRLVGETADNRNYQLDDTVMNEKFDFRPFCGILTGSGEVWKWCSRNANDLDNDKYYTIRMWKKYYKEYLNG